MPMCTGSGHSRKFILLIRLIAFTNFQHITPTQTAIMVGSGVGARHGILLKSGEAIEESRHIKAVVFDKTGTLTFGRPTVQDVLLLSDRCATLFDTIANEKALSKVQADTAAIKESYLNRLKTLENIFYLAASAEHGSEHPLAKGKIDVGVTVDAIVCNAHFINFH
jgi:cation transport ATPase